MVSVIHSALKSFEILQASLIGKVDTEQVRVHDEAVRHVHVYNYYDQIAKKELGPWCNNYCIHMHVHVCLY